MTTLTFVFNDEKVKESGQSISQIMNPIKADLISAGAKEIQPFVFSAEGINADTIFTSQIVKLTKKDYNFIRLLDKWVLNSNGEEEDCIEETKNWYRRKGIQCEF